MRENHNLSGDLKSLKLVSCLLVNSGFIRIEYGFRGDGYDILAISENDCVYLFNVKQRKFRSDKYGDLTLDESDFNSLQWAKKRYADDGHNVKAVYIQFFTDDVMFISNDEGWYVIERNCPTTTQFSNNTYIDKRLKQKMQDADGVTRIDTKNVSLDKMKLIYC